MLEAYPAPGRPRCTASVAARPAAAILRTPPPRGSGMCYNPANPRA